MIFDALDQPMVNTSWRSGDPDMDCMVAAGMADVMDGIYKDMDVCCRKRLGEISVYDVDCRLTAIAAT